MTKNSILLFKGGFQYNVVNYFVDDLAESFNAFGYTSIIIDLLKDNYYVELQDQINKNNVRGFFSFNGIGLPDVGKLATALRIPFINFYLDSSIYHLARLQFKSDYLKIVFMDKAELQLVKEVLGQEAVYIPHGAYTKVNPVEVNHSKEGIIFAGSICNPEVFRKQWLGLGNTLGKFYDDLLEHISNKECFHIIQDVDYILNLKGYELNKEQKKAIYLNSVLVHRYIRSYRRLKVLEMLKDYPIDIYGHGWKSVPLQAKHVYHGGIDFLQLIEKIRKAKILLNVLPEFIYGGHERIFTSMYYETAVITNYNAYLKTNFQDDQDLIFYSMRSLDRLADKVSGLLDDDPAKLARISQSGNEKVAAKHTWLNRAEEILKLIEER